MDSSGWGALLHSVLLNWHFCEQYLLWPEHYFTLTVITMVSIFYSSSMKIKSITLRTQTEKSKSEFCYLLSRLQ